MEINRISQFRLNLAEQNDSTKIKKDVLKGIKLSIDEKNTFKLNKEKSFSKFSSEEIYDLDFRTVIKNIMDLNVPLCDSCGGGGG